MDSIIYLVLIVGVFYFMLIMPEQRKQKKFKAMVEALKVGDVVFTRGGIKGTIIHMEEEVVTIATGPEKVKLYITRQGIGTVVSPLDADAATGKEPVKKKKGLFW